ncbi:MAG: MaoC family dehydratase N-terminal domain-containing protein [Anaerolineales bacterium]|nr:MaoC family dehydratase N-terminal domain-containing protein [Anaerolineales bacterium]
MVTPTLKRGLTFDEFAVGDTFVSPGRTVTEADVVAFAGLSGDYNPLHTDAVFASQGQFGERIAHGMLVAAIGAGLGNQMGMLEGTTLALMEQVIRYKGAVKFGDTVYLRLAVKEKRETSRPERGVVIFDAPIVNQAGQTVIEMQWTLLMKRSAEAAPGAAKGRGE